MITENKVAINKIEADIDVIRKKLPGDEDFLKKFASEKKIWLDQLSEDRLIHVSKKFFLIV